MNLVAFSVLVVAAAVQDEDVEEVAAEAEAGSDEHEFSVYLGGVL